MSVKRAFMRVAHLMTNRARIRSLLVLCLWNGWWWQRNGRDWVTENLPTVMEDRTNYSEQIICTYSNQWYGSKTARVIRAIPSSGQTYARSCFHMRRAEADSAHMVPGPRSWLSIQPRNFASRARSNGLVKMSATMSSVLTRTGFTSSIYNRFTNSVVRSKYLVRCVLPGLMITSLEALQSVMRMVGPCTCAPRSSSTSRTPTVSLAAREATTVSASAVLSGINLTFLALYWIAPLHIMITWPPKGCVSTPHELSW